MGDDELVLDRKEMDMLKALNSFVTIPALSSNAMRIICDEDLEIRGDETTAVRQPQMQQEDKRVEQDEIIEEDIRPKRESHQTSLFSYTPKTDQLAKKYQFSKNRLPTKTRKSRPLLKTYDLADVHQFQLKR